MDNFTPRDNRTIEHGQLVAVHWNAHKQTYSILAMKSANSIGNVIGYADNITLTDCRFKIDRTKQQIVHKEQRKERHAFIVGHVQSLTYTPCNKRIYYNPYKLQSFVDADTYFSGTTEYLQTVQTVGMHNAGKPVVTYNN
jgi:hypothetical protein